MTGNYTEFDIEELYEAGEWVSWEEMYEWLKVYGKEDPDLNPDEIDNIILDLSRLDEDNFPFTDDPHKTFDILKALKPQK